MKKFLYILLLLLYSQLGAQNYELLNLLRQSQIETETPSGELLLDTDNAYAAWSVRKLRTDYVGPALRVRRSSDNTQMDIGFVGNDLDVASLLAFVGVGSGFVTIWYDQTGNNIHLPQATEVLQLRIVDTGVLVTSYGEKACLETTSFNNGFPSTSTYTPSMFNFMHQSQATVSYVQSTTTGSYIMVSTDAMTLTTRVGISISGGRHIVGNGGGTGYVVYHEFSFGNGHTLWDYNCTEPNIVLKSNLRHNSIQEEDNTGNQTPSLTDSFKELMVIGRRNGSTAREGNYQEFIIWNTRQSANRAFIEANTNTYYSIY